MVYSPLPPPPPMEFSRTGIFNLNLGTSWLTQWTSLLPRHHISVITAHIRRMGKVMFSVCLSVHTGWWVTLSPSHNTSTGSMFFLGQVGYPCSGILPLPGLDWVPPSSGQVTLGQVTARAICLCSFPQEDCLVYDMKITLKLEPNRWILATN